MNDLPPVVVKGKKTLGYGQLAPSLHRSGSPPSSIETITEGGSMYPNKPLVMSIDGGRGVGGVGGVTIEHTQQMMAPPGSAPGPINRSNSAVYNNNNNYNNSNNSNNSNRVSSSFNKQSGWIDTDGHFHPFVHVLTQPPQPQPRQVPRGYSIGSLERIGSTAGSDIGTRSSGDGSVGMLRTGGSDAAVSYTYSSDGSSIIDNYSNAYLNNNGASDKNALKVKKMERGNSLSSVGRYNTASSTTSTSSLSYPNNKLLQADYVAIRIQKIVRGRQCRRRLWQWGGILYVHQVVKVQKTFRRFWSNKFIFMPIYVKWIHKMANIVKSIYYKWLYKQRKRISQAKFVARMVLYIQSLYRGREDRKKFRKMRQAMRNAASVKIQRYTRGYFARKRRKYIERQMAMVWESMKGIATADMNVARVVGSSLRLQDVYNKPFDDPIDALHICLSYLLLIDRTTICIDIMQSLFWSVFDRIPSLRRVYECVLFSCWAAYGKTNDKKTEYLARALYFKFKECERYRAFPDNIVNCNECDASLVDDLSGCHSIDTKYPWFKDSPDFSCSFNGLCEKIEVLYFTNIILRLKSNFRIRFLVTTWQISNFDLYLLNTLTTEHSTVDKFSRDANGSDDSSIIRTNSRAASRSNANRAGLNDNESSTFAGTTITGHDDDFSKGELSMKSNSQNSQSSNTFGGFDYSRVSRKHTILTDRYREWCEAVTNNTSKTSLNHIRMAHQLILTENIFGKFHKVIYKKLGKKFNDLKVFDYIKLKALQERLAKENHSFNEIDIKKAFDNISAMNVYANFIVVQCGDCLIVQIHPRNVEITFANRKFLRMFQKKFSYVDITNILSDKWKETVIYPLFLTLVEVKFVYELAVVYLMKLLKLEYSDVINRTRNKNIGEYLESCVRIVSTANIKRENKHSVDEAEGQAWDDNASIGSEESNQRAANDDLPLDPSHHHLASSPEKNGGSGRNAKGGNVIGGDNNSMGSLAAYDIDSDEEDAKSVTQKRQENDAIMAELQEASPYDCHFRTVIPFIEYKRVELNEKNIYIHNILSIQRCFRGFLGRSKSKRIRIKKRDLHRQLEKSKVYMAELMAVKKMRYRQASLIQAVIRGFNWRRRLMFLNHMALIVQNNTRIYLSKLELARRIRRRDFGPDLILVMKKSIAIDISMSSRNGSTTGYNVNNSVSQVPSVAMSYINMKANEAVMSISLACTVWRCGNNYKITANNYITNDTYDGYIYYQQVAKLIEDYNVLASDEISRTSKYSQDNISQHSQMKSEASSTGSSRSKEGKERDNRFQIVKISIADDKSQRSEDSVSRIAILKIYHYERIADLLLTKIEINPIAREALADFKKYHFSRNPKATLVIRSGNDQNTYEEIVENVNFTGLQKVFTSQSTVTLTAKDYVIQQLHPQLMKTTASITKGFEDKHVWESIAPIYSHNPNIIGSSNLKGSNNFYQYKTESRILRDQKSIAEKYFKYLRTKSSNIIVTAGDQSVRHNEKEKPAAAIVKRAKTPDKKKLTSKMLF